MSEAVSTCDVSLLIPHPSRAAVLVVNSEPASEELPPTLPTIRLDTDEPTLTEILAGVEAVISALGPVLRCVITTQTGSAEASDASMLVEFEPHSVDAPVGWKWWSLDQAGLAALEPAASREAIGDWVREREHGWSALRPAWSRPGWFARASAWLAQQAAADGHPLVDVPRQHQLWDISVVLRATSTSGEVFFKCSPDVFRHEAAATQSLAGVTPEFLPSVIAVDSREGWLLMRDLGATELGEQAESSWHEGLRAHARIQQAWLHRTEELIALGLPVRSLPDLASQVATLSDDSDLMNRTPEELRGRWLANVPAFVASCHRLDEIGPGPTLVHGDLHPWNVVGPENTRIFDWTDAAVSHPFVDLATFVARSEDPDVRRKLIEAYVDTWAPVLPSETLLEAAALGMIVGALYQVMTYRTLLATMPNGGRDAGLDGADISCIKRSVRWQDNYSSGATDVMSAPS